jgi:hypothetical protein
MHSETGEEYKMNAHHAPPRQGVEEIRLGRSKNRGVTTRMKEVRKGYERSRR